MDVLFFLKERTAFIRKFYELAVTPFVERKRKIEAEEEPFEPPSYDEYDGEPPYLAEWMETDDSLHILAYSCVSMLAAALQLYFKTWESELGKPTSDLFKAEFKNNGWLAGYKAYFAYYLGIRFEDCPANLELLEEVVLARNRVQHPDSITNLRDRYSISDLRKLAHPFFLDEATGIC